MCAQWHKDGASGRLVGVGAVPGAHSACALRAMGVQLDRLRERDDLSLPGLVRPHGFVVGGLGSARNCARAYSGAVHWICGDDCSSRWTGIRLGRTRLRGTHFGSAFTRFYE